MPGATLAFARERYTKTTPQRDKGTASDGQRDKELYGRMDERAGRKTARQAGRQAGRQADRQAGRQANKEL